MSADPVPRTLFHFVGLGVAASQIFETIFVVAARLVLKSAANGISADVDPILDPKWFKQPAKALLKELGEAQVVEPGLEARMSRLIDDRHRMIHRLFYEFGWPAPMTRQKEEEFTQLCLRVVGESQAVSQIFVDAVLNWMRLFPATSQTAIEYEERFKELAARIVIQSARINSA